MLYINSLQRLDLLSLRLERFKHIVLLFAIVMPLAGTGLLLGTQLLRNKHKKYLFLLFLDVALVFTITFFKYTDRLEVYSHLFPIQVFLSGLVFPLFYWYLQQLTDTASRPLKNISLLYHSFFPLLASCLFMVLMYGIMDGTDRNTYMRHFVFEPHRSHQFLYTMYVFERIVRFIFILQTLIYIVLYVRLYRKHKQHISDRFSWETGINLHWLTLVTLIALLSAIINAGLQLLKTKQLLSQDVVLISSHLIFIVLILVLAYYTIRQKDIYSECLQQGELQANGRYISKANFVYYMKHNKPYLQAELTIYDLCPVFGSNRTYMSNFINTEFGMNFRTLINTYRIEAAKKIIASAKADCKMDQVAEQCGFKSYSTFLRSFKEQVGLAPTAYCEVLKR